MFKSKFVTDLNHIEIEFYGDKFSIDKKNLQRQQWNIINVLDFASI